MRICPKCKTEYDDSKAFCRKDGTKLVPSMPPEALAKRTLLEERIAQQPDDPALYLDYASYLQSVELFDASVEQLETALRHGADSSEVRRRLVQVYASQKDWDNAAVQLTLLLECTPDDVQLRKDLVKAYLRGGRRDSAVQQVSAIAEAFSQDIDVLRWCRDQLGQMDQSGSLCEICRRIIEIDGTDTDTWACLAATLETKGSPEAVDAWESLLKLRPLDANANLYAGIARFAAALESGVGPWPELAAMFGQALAGDNLSEQQSKCARLFQACAHVQAGQHASGHLNVLASEGAAHGEIGKAASTAAYRCLAEKRLEAGYAEAGLEYAKRANKLLDNEATRNTLGLTHTAAGDAMMKRRKWQDASRHYAQAKSASPADMTIDEKQKCARKRLQKRRFLQTAFLAAMLCAIVAALLIHQYGWQSLEIRTNENATISIQRFGKNVFRGQGYEVRTAPLRISPYTIHAEKPGYHSRTERLWITFGNSTRTIQLSLEPVYGALKINSEPAGAEVIVGGESKGFTPLTVERLQALPTQIELRKENVGVHVTEVNVPADETLDLGVITLAANLGALRVDSSPPGAAVLIDGKKVGTTPAVLNNITVGRHLLRLETQSGEPREQFIEIIAGEILDTGKLSMVNTFHCQYQSSDGGRLNSVVESDDGSFFIGGSLGFDHLLLAQVDATGVPMATYTQSGDSGTAYVKDLLVTEEGRLVAMAVLQMEKVDGRLWLMTRKNLNEPLWQQCVGDTGDTYDEAFAMCHDGGFIVASDKWDSYGSIKICRLDGAGAILWTKGLDAAREHPEIAISKSPDGQESGRINGSSSVSAVVCNPDGTFILAGDYGVITKGGHYIPFLASFSASGEVVWIRSYKELAKKGGDTRVIALFRSDDAYVAIGHAGDGWLNSSGYEAWIMAVDSEGTPLWQRSHTHDSKNSVAAAADKDPTGGYIVAGRVAAGPRLNEGALWILRLDDQGEGLWSHTYGAPGEFYPNTVVATRDGAFAIGGEFKGTGGWPPVAWLAKLDSMGSFGGVFEFPEPTLHTWPQSAPDAQAATVAETRSRSEQLGENNKRASEANDTAGIVTANLLNLRATPSLSGQAKDALVEGATVSVVRSRDDWLEVRCTDGRQGWVHGDYVLRGEDMTRAPRGAGRGQLTGTWRGIWERTDGDKADFQLHVMLAGATEFRAEGTVEGWPAWQVFEGRVSGDKVTLKGIGVTKNQRPTSEIEFNVLNLILSDVGLRLEGKWSGENGAIGAVQLRFVTRDTEVGE